MGKIKRVTFERLDDGSWNKIEDDPDDSDFEFVTHISMADGYEQMAKLKSKGWKARSLIHFDGFVLEKGKRENQVSEGMEGFSSTMKCAACGRRILGKGRELSIQTGPETALFCEDAMSCQRSTAFSRISVLLAGGATVKSALTFLERGDDGRTKTSNREKARRT